jgi:hypothetical protein
MYGQITKFRHDLGIGVICAENGRKYRFRHSEMVNAAAQLVGEDVHFITDAGRPRQIIAMSGSPWTVFGAIPAHA